MSSSAPSPSFRTGPKMAESGTSRFVGIESTEIEKPTWRGWVLGFFFVAVLCLVIPYVDFVLHGTMFSNSMFPTGSTFFLFVLVGAITVALSIFRSHLGLTKQDLALCFCMSLAANAIPGCGFWAFWQPTVMGGNYFATADNGWNETIVPHIPADWQAGTENERNLFRAQNELTLAKARLDKAGEKEKPATQQELNRAEQAFEAARVTLEKDPTPRTLDSFYQGLPLPPNATFLDRLKLIPKIPWGAWVRPYLLWSFAIAMMLGVVLALAGLIRRQWSDRERLAFPLVQLSSDLMSGLYANESKPFLKDKMAWLGMSIALLYTSWNSLADFTAQAIPRLELSGSVTKYLTEPPFSYLRPVDCYVYLSIIALTYLLSLEVSFSLWFFYLIMKVETFFAVLSGIGDSGYYFSSINPTGHRGMLIDQGVGALMMMTLASFWAARGELFDSLLQAIGRRPQTPESGDCSPRFWWALLAVCALGSLGFMLFIGIDLKWALPMLFIFIVTLVGCARLYCEGGIFYMQVYEFPITLLGAAVTPAAFGTQQYVRLAAWDRVMVSDWYRVTFMPGMLHGLHLAKSVGLRLKSMALAIVLALVFALGLSFFSMLFTAHATPGGANAMSWYFKDFPTWHYKPVSANALAIDEFNTKKEVAEREGRTVNSSETPDVARPDLIKFGWLGTGAGTMGGLLYLRSFAAWCPHPIGLVMWMGQYPLHMAWFSFFLGWLFKSSILKFGGGKTYLEWKRFFLGIVVGEAVAVVLWLMVAAAAGKAITSTLPQ